LNVLRWIVRIKFASLNGSGLTWQKHDRPSLARHQFKARYGVVSASPKKNWPALTWPNTLKSFIFHIKMARSDWAPIVGSTKLSGNIGADFRSSVAFRTLKSMRKVIGPQPIRCSRALEQLQPLDATWILPTKYS
jgi:hypothetical protein